MSSRVAIPPKSASLLSPARTDKELGQPHSVLDRLQRLFPHSPRPTPSTPTSAAATRPGDDMLLESPADSTNPNLPSSGPVDPKFLKIRLLTWNMHDSLPKGDLEELLGKVPVYSRPTVPSGTFPSLPNDENHSYHLVVVAGQECPTPSGIPMGLAASFKILDKDRDRSKDSDKENERPHRSDDRLSSRPEDEFETPSGWTSMVEDWLCNNAAASSRNTSPSVSDVGHAKLLMRQKSSKDMRKGPYQLLIKERLMGIYLAIYVHRDLKPFVRGMSKSAVTAGLIGGRVGNKGGVGISLNIDGTTFLFLNAHLAAHEGKMHHRLANLAKIKSELQVDDFLSKDDPRHDAEDLTQRFDFTFLCGDLNFRLNISRLHADWLIARQDYAQALEFDQLRLLMKEGNLPGFREGLIDFPPTFKYDVLRTVRRSKRTSTRRLPIDSSERILGAEDENLIEIEEPEDDMEGGSILSSTVTSMNSRSGTEPGHEYESDFDFSSSPGHRIDSTSNASVAAMGVKKARLKILSLLSPSLSPTDKILKAKRRSESLAPPMSPFSLLRTSSPSLVASRDSSEPVKKRPPPMVLSSQSQDTQRNSIEELAVEDRGVYDSSSKKRVPSWCDRVLWKTTITAPKLPFTPLRTGLSPGIERAEAGRSRGKKSNFFFRSLTPRTPLSAATATPATAKMAPIDEHETINTLYSHSTEHPYQSITSPESGSHNSSLPKYLQALPRRTHTTGSPPATAPLPYDRQHPSRRATDGVDSPLSADRPQSTLWRFLPSFFSPTLTQATITPDTATIPSPSPLPARGEVQCLTYNTLDDRQMRRLEGRSDHRPVIGTYTVYI